MSQKTDDSENKNNVPAQQNTSNNAKIHSVRDLENDPDLKNLTNKKSPSLSAKTSPSPQFYRPNLNNLKNSNDMSSNYGISKEVRERRKVEEKNRKLIEQIKENNQQTNNKSKKRKIFWIWLLLLLFFLGGGTTGIVMLAIKGVPSIPPVSNPVSVTIQGDFTFYESEADNVMPGTKFDKELWVKNTSGEETNIFIRFYSETYVHGVKTSSSMLTLTPYISSNFIQGTDGIFYYKGYLSSEESIKIISGVIVNGTNSEANQECTHKVVVEAVEAIPSAIEEVWPTAPYSYISYMMNA